MLATLQRLGIVPSFSRLAVSDDNPYPEGLFMTLEYTLSYPKKPCLRIAIPYTRQQNGQCYSTGRATPPGTKHPL